MVWIEYFELGGWIYAFWSVLIFVISTRWSVLVGHQLHQITVLGREIQYGRVI
jgi:hypothetical protein